ncbi:MAG: EamA family transporter, partial [Acidimicrobiales bacterium]
MFVRRNPEATDDYGRSGMEAAAVVALVAGALWGLNMVASRWGLDTTGTSSEVGAFVSVGVAALVAGGTALVGGVDTHGFGVDSMARYALVGAIAPGASQGMFLTAIRSIGPARTGVLLATSPMFSVLLAIALTAETLESSVIVGTTLTITGGIMLAHEPDDRGVRAFVRIGSLFAVITALAFGIRDVAARELLGDVDLEVWWAATMILVSGALVSGTVVVLRGERLLPACRRALPEMALSGLLVGVALPALIWALSRGDVGLVAPLANGSQVMTVVTVSTLVYGASERSGRVGPGRRRGGGGGRRGG